MSQKKALCDSLTYGDCCDECGSTNQPYMLTHELWKQVKKGSEMFLCLICVEKRLGRVLRMADFLLTAPINYGIFGFDCREWARLGGEEVEA